MNDTPQSFLEKRLGLLTVEMSDECSPGFGYVWEGGGEDLSADFANDNWAWNTFNVTDDGSMNVHHVSFKCKQG